MTAGLETDHRKRRAELAQLAYVLAVQAPGPGLTGVSQPGATVPGLGSFLPLDEDFHCLGTRAHQPVAPPPTETAAVGHQVQGLEQAGLAGAVIASDQVESRGGFDR